MIRFLFALLFAVVLACGADARPRGSTADMFNGGKTQLGVNFLQIANDFAFMNAFKGAQEWGYVDNTAKPDPSELSSDGYPIPGSNCFSHGGVYSVFYVPLQSERPGNYVATWDGISTLYTGMGTTLTSATFTGSIAAGILTAGAPSGGTIQKGMAISTIGGIIGNQLTGSAGGAGTYLVTGLTTAGSQSMTVTGGSKTGAAASGNRWVFSVTGTSYRFTAGFAAATQTPSNLKIFHVDDEDELNAGRILGKQFRTQFAYMGPPGVIRYLDWQLGNISNLSKWDQRRPVSYAFYAGSEMRSTLWAGVTTNVGDAYTAPLTPSSWTGLVDRATVIVKFNATATSDASTLTVAGVTKNIRDPSGNATSTNNNSRPQINRISTLVYDAGFDVWLKFGGDAAYGDTGLVSGVPPEVMLQASRELGAHPYVVQPFLSADPPTDYMPSMATLFKNTGSPWMIPRYEGPNELWNTAGGFWSANYGANRSALYWGSGGFMQWSGMVFSLLGQSISTVYANDRSKYWVLAGVQSATACGDTACTIDNTAASNARLTAASWISAGSPTYSGYTVSAAYNWATHVVLANYTNGTLYRSLQELRDGFGYVVTNAGNPSAQAALADTYANGLSGNLTPLKNRAQYWYNWANSNWGGSINLGLTAYEGGWSPDFNSNNWTSAVTGATVGNPCVLALSTTTAPGASAISGNAAVAGMTLTISGLGGSLGTLLNGNTYTVQSGVSGNNVPINVDCSATAFTTSGSALYVNSPLYVNTLRWASKFSTNLQTHMATHYADLKAVGVVYPSQFFFAGPAINNDSRNGGGVIGQGQIWGLWDQSVYATPYSPVVEMIRAFNMNFLLKRDLDPTSNDNSPMWLEKAA